MLLLRNLRRCGGEGVDEGHERRRRRLMAVIIVTIAFKVAIAVRSMEGITIAVAVATRGLGGRNWRRSGIKRCSFAGWQDHAATYINWHWVVANMLIEWRLMLPLLCELHLFDNLSHLLTFAF